MRCQIANLNGRYNQKSIIAHQQRQVRTAGLFAPADLLIALGITVFCVTIFYYLAEIPLRLFGPWLDFLGIVA